MQYRYGYPVMYVDSCLDAPWGEWPDYDPERVHYLGRQLNMMFQTLEDMFGLKIDETVWNNSRPLAGRLYNGFNEINKLLAANPVPLGVAENELILNYPYGCTGVAMQEGAEAVEILVKELKERVDKGIGVVPKNSPRVVLAFQSLIDPVFNHLFEEVGLGVPVAATMLPPPKFPESKPYSTLGEKRAEIAMVGGPYHSSYGGIKRMQESLKFANVDGIIYNYQYSCRPMVCNSKLMKQYLEKETGLPTLLLDMDFYDNRNYSAAALQTRLEAFAEMLRARKAAV
jgi:benzoyl-CoA reductase/2-hydroxyglutaryl-CoA dehydratase subunit BcrC/BadD/HgdB